MTVYSANRSPELSVSQPTLVRIVGEGQHAWHAGMHVDGILPAPTRAGPDSDEDRPTLHDVGEHTAHQRLKSEQ